MAIILSMLYCCYFFITAALLFVGLALAYPFALLFDPHRRVHHYLTSLWGYHFVQLNPFWDCRIEGRQHLEHGCNYVMVANHQSLADIFVLSGLRHNYKWVSKESLLSIPFFGWNMKLNRYIAIKRGDVRSIREMMTACKNWLHRGVSIMMFPEGTRSESGQLGPFRDGSFRLSLECNVPLVPIVITGTRDVIAKNSRTFNFRARMRIKILPPVLPAAFEGSAGRMREYVHGLMKTTLQAMQQETLVLAEIPVGSAGKYEAIDR